MAVKVLASTNTYQGLSSDTKPTAGTLVGSAFRETDTGHSFCWDGSAWNFCFPNIDAHSHGAMVIVSHIQHEVHAGHFWTASNAETLASGSVSSILLETPGSAVSTVHMMVSFHSSAAGTMVFGEGEGGTVGTAIIPQNNHRPTAGSSGLVSISNTTAGTVGTVLSYIVMGAGSPAGKIGGDLDSGNPWILEHGMRYSLQFTCSAATNVAWNLFWIEEEA